MAATNHDSALLILHSGCSIQLPMSRFHITEPSLTWIRECIPIFAKSMLCLCHPARPPWLHYVPQDGIMSRAIWTRVPGLAPNALENQRTLGDRIIEMQKSMHALSIAFEIRRICWGRDASPRTSPASLSLKRRPARLVSTCRLCLERDSHGHRQALPGPLGDSPRSW